jgi:hypothetical protein
LSDPSVRPETRSGDPFAFAAEWERIRRSRRTEEELAWAIREDEERQGRPMTPSERTEFARGFFSQEYGEEIRILAAQGLLDEEDEEG